MKKLFFVAGGTGGHIFPAISLGQWIEEREMKNVKIEYICGSRPLEWEIFSQNNIAPTVLPIEGSPLGVLKAGKVIRRLGSLFSAFLQSVSLIREDRPDVCVLFGGYVSFPPMLACLLHRIPLVIHEQNSVAGKVTRLAKKFGIPVLSGWQECRPLEKDQFNYVGIPIRKFKKVDRIEAWGKLYTGVDFPKGAIVGVLSGSLTSSPLFKTICELASAPDLKNVTFLVVGGKGRCPDINTLIAVERQWDMSIVYSVVDAVIARAGASTLSELMVLNIPSLIVPWRGASDGHQVRNAVLFEKETMGNFVWDEQASVFELKHHLIDCVSKVDNGTKLDERSQRGFEDRSCERIWDVLISLMRRESL
jgi:UDP-N-acetylglucosamine--N-acetylmuramyl-(pentapeptide) pyrophosphoryl-undecaprenol N-acetylglucosamine transferase